MLYEPSPQDRERYQAYDILIATPNGDFSNPAVHTRCLANMIAYSWMHGLKIYQMGSTQRTVVDWARNALARKAREHINEYTNRPFTHIFWLDDDQIFNPDLGVLLARNGDLEMISALYFMRDPPHWPVVYVQDYTTQYQHFHVHALEQAVVQVDAVGFGALLMRREVLDRVPEPWFTICPEYGEDIGFCTHARRAGVKIFCDGGVRIGHLGSPPIITEADNQRVMQGSMYQADMVQMEMATRHNPIEQAQPGEAPVIWRAS